jgi:hypothetical protein
MFDSYPADIRGWLNAKGGLDQMPLAGYWMMPARDLWQMGYRRCAIDSTGLPPTGNGVSPAQAPMTF